VAELRQKSIKSVTAFEKFIKLASIKIISTFLQMCYTQVLVHYQMTDNFHIYYG